MPVRCTNKAKFLRLDHSSRRSRRFDEHCVTPAAEHGGPMIFAQMGMMQAIHRHHKREFNPARKDTFGKSGS
jgi:hypothetical protein